jgi:hypothetical protein
MTNSKSRKSSTASTVKMRGSLASTVKMRPSESSNKRSMKLFTIKNKDKITLKSVTTFLKKLGLE